MWGDKQAEVLQSVFNELSNNRVKWLVFRNHEGLPKNNQSKDVDLLVKRNQIKQSIKIIKKVMVEYGYSKFTFDRFQCIWCFSFFKEDLFGIDSIKIDLFYGQVWRGVETVSFEKIYANTKLYNGFLVPNDVMNSFLLWIKPVMTGGVVKEKYIQSILSNSNEEQFYDLIKTTFSTKILNEVKPYFTLEKINESAAFQKRLCRKSWIKGFIKNPIRRSYDTFMHFFLEVIRRSHRPKGTFICVLGPDGVGKSTVLELVQEEARKTFLRDPEKISLFHFRPRIIPNLKKLLKRNYDESQEEFTNPHREQVSGTLVSFVRMMYYWLDYLLGKRGFRKATVRGELIIFDRYIYDFIVDPRRFKVSLPKFLRKVFVNLSPQPDKVFILLTEPEVIYSRKQELELQEIERQVKEYISLAEGHSKFRILNASLSPDELSKTIVLEWVKTLKTLT